MRFTPMSPTEIKNMGLLPDGQYNFVVADAKEQISKAGNEMIKLELKIEDAQGRLFTVYDYIMEKMSYKLIAFCQATELTTAYEAGLLTSADCMGKRGFVEIYIDEDRTGAYPNKNAVKTYLTSKANDGAPALKPVDEVADFFADEHIPF